MLRQHLALLRTSLAWRIAPAVVVASLVTLSAGAGTAIAGAHGDLAQRGLAHGEFAHPGLGHGSPQGDSAQGTNTTAVAINTTDHALVFKLTFAILRVTGNVVDNQNIAVAYATCNGCQTVAISIQTLLTDGPATTVVPINEASARNQNCNQCDTVAIAYQFVIAGGTKLEFTREGRRQIAYIERQLERLRETVRRSGMTGEQIVAAVSTLMQQYAGVLSTQLVPAGQPAATGGSSDTSTTATSSPSQTPTVGTVGTTSSTTQPSGSTTTSTATAPTSAPTDSGTTSTTTTGTTPTTTTTGTTPTTTTGTAPTPTTGTGTGTGTTSTTTTTGTAPTTTTTTGTTPTTTTTTSTTPTTTTSGTTTTPSGTTTTTSSSTTP